MGKLRIIFVVYGVTDTGAYKIRDLIVEYFGE
jgi:hypothetical protein